MDRPSRYEAAYLQFSSSFWHRLWQTVTYANKYSHWTQLYLSVIDYVHITINLIFWEFGLSRFQVTIEFMIVLLFGFLCHYEWLNHQSWLYGLFSSMNQLVFFVGSSSELLNQEQNLAPKTNNHTISLWNISHLASICPPWETEQNVSIYINI